MTIFLYLRFSSENQSGGVSIEMQRSAIRSYIAAHPELKTYALVERLDEAKSATTLKGRDGLAAIRNEARAGDLVIVFKLDRLGRNLLDSLKVLKDFEEKNVRVISTSEPDMPLVRHMLLAMSEEFSRQLSDRCKRALDGIAESGFVTNGAPYGYEIRPAGNRKKLMPVAEEAAVVQRIYKMRAEGKSHRDIVRALNNDKVPSPRNGLWSLGCTSAMLKNETYLGKIISGQRIFKKGHGLQGFRPRSEWSIGENAHEAIINEDLWQQVRQRDSKTAHGHKRSSQTRGMHLLSGFLRCSECGANLVIDKSKQRKFYGCQSGRDQGIKKPCRCRSLVRVELADMVVREILLHQLYSEEWLKEVVAAFREEVTRARGTVDNVMPILERELRQKEQRIESATRSLVHVDEDLRPVFLDELRKLKTERDALKAQIDGAKKESGHLSVDGLEEKFRERLGHLDIAIRNQDVQQARIALAEHLDHVAIAPNLDAVLVGKPASLLAGTEFVHIPSRLRTLSGDDDRVKFNYWTARTA